MSHGWNRERAAARDHSDGRQWMHDPTLRFELTVACGLAVAAVGAFAIVVGPLEGAWRLL
jgi:hypothetical protein